MRLICKDCGTEQYPEDESSTRAGAVPCPQCGEPLHDARFLTREELELAQEFGREARLEPTGSKSARPRKKASGSTCLVKGCSRPRKEWTPICFQHKEMLSGSLGKGLIGSYQRHLRDPKNRELYAAAARKWQNAMSYWK